MFIINFAKENLFKHGISFDVVGATIGRLFIFIKYTFYACYPVEQMYSCIDNKYYLMLYFNYKRRFFANMFQLIMRKNKSELPDEIVDNLMKIHSIHNDKYAPIGNAICDSWYDYYSELVKWIVKFTNGYYVSQIVKNVC